MSGAPYDLKRIATEVRLVADALNRLAEVLADEEAPKPRPVYGGILDSYPGHQLGRRDTGNGRANWYCTGCDFSLPGATLNDAITRLNLYHKAMP